jgi:hypothetical protein
MLFLAFCLLISRLFWSILSEAQKVERQSRQELKPPSLHYGYSRDLACGGLRPFPQHLRLSQAPKKERPFIPRMNARVFWAISCKL